MKDPSAPSGLDRSQDQPERIDFESLVGAELASALEKRGFTSLMPVQAAVLDPALAGRDLRISSQTGSGKTVAIGLALRELAREASPAEKGTARPRALVVVPTRELAKQVDEELRWLYAPIGAKVASATGGTSVRDERRTFHAGPSVVVGTPGRLLDHLQRGGIDASQVGAVVLDEADRMLDLGFREELEAILKHAPPGHRTHLVSATFSRDVRALADRVQNDPARIEATPLGTANADIDHLVHLVPMNQRLAAIVNLLLATPGAPTLVFARTRADVADLTRELADAGFNVRALSGEMEQGERNRALAAFKTGKVHALVATDVAARGIDVQDLGRVIHAEPPTDADSYIHRSGRTGRAGKKGISSILVSPAGLARTSQLLRRSRVQFRMEPIPTAAALRAASDDRLLAELTADEETEASDRVKAIAARLASSPDVVRTIARLLTRAHVASGPEPREVTAIAVPTDRPLRPRQEPDRTRPRAEHLERWRPHRGEPGAESPRDSHRSTSTTPDGPRPPSHPEGPPARERPPHRERTASSEGNDERRPASRAPRMPEGGWVPFRFTWGQEHGADPRRLLAMACRRGGVQASDIGAIHVGRNYSVVEVARPAAASFEQAAGQPDPRDPRVNIRPQEERGGGAGASPRPREERAASSHRPQEQRLGDTRVIHRQTERGAREERGGEARPKRKPPR
jgi:ATP-dependent RNA helicase DeaD